MMSRVWVAALLAGISVSAQAEQLVRPGLWEVTTSNVQVGGQQIPDLGGLMQQIGALSGDQKKRMQDMLGQQGMSLGQEGMRACLSERQVQRDTLMLQSGGSDCRQQVTENRGNQWSFRFQCPQASGTGVAQILSDREFTSSVKGNFTAPGMGTQPGSMDYRGRWLGADCGTLKPAR